MRKIGALLLAAAAFTCVSAEPRVKLELTIDNIMRGPALVGYPPQDVRWSGDSKQIFFRWKQAADDPRAPLATYVANRDGSGLRKLTEAEARLAAPLHGSASRHRRFTAYAVDGDLFLYDHLANTSRRLTHTREKESHPAFTRDSNRLGFQREGNLYVLSLNTGEIVQMTDIRPGSEPEKKETDSRQSLIRAEKELLESVRERIRRKEEKEAREKQENPRKPFWLGPELAVRELRLSPDERYVVAKIAKRARAKKKTVVPSFVTENAYTDTIPSRVKVGDDRDEVRLALISAADGEVRWIDPQEKDRAVTLSMPVWSEDGSKAVVMGRSADNKDRWIFALDTDNAQLRPLHHDRDEAWVDGPASSTLGWLCDNRHVYFVSEHDGYAHLYTVGFEDGKLRQLTSGQWEVEEVSLTPDGARFILMTSEAGPAERHLYVMGLNGGERVRLTTGPGRHEGAVSPDGRWLARIHSYTNRPPELFVQETRPDAPSKRITTSPASEFFTYPWTDVPIVQVPARDGVLVPARLYKPQGWHSGGPAVIFVHGAGYLQNVHRWWSSYSREYMFHHFLMERGYLVLDVDYRGSAGYGRDWRTAIYRHMGGKDLDDQVDAARWLATEHGVDPRRIGIYGGSYGGFITLMAMFTQPDVFQAGAALRPVTDWAHYNHGYTSNILNTPQGDPEAYRRSSPIYFAEGLKGALLLCHGMVDENVHFQDTIRLVQRLIELRKENWELAVYPVEDHAFVDPASWADEYKRIFRLFETHLRLPKP